MASDREELGVPGADRARGRQRLRADPSRLLEAPRGDQPVAERRECLRELGRRRLRRHERDRALECRDPGIALTGGMQVAAEAVEQPHRAQWVAVADQLDGLLHEFGRARRRTRVPGQLRGAITEVGEVGSVRHLGPEPDRPFEVRARLGQAEDRLRVARRGDGGGERLFAAPRHRPVWREIRGGRAGARELLGDPAMQLLALARQDRRVHGLGQQRVAEPKRAGILVGDEDSLVDGLAERLTVFRTHQRRADVPSGGGDQPQEVSIESAHALEQHVAEASRQLASGREQLLGEEWIAARALRDRARTPGVGEQRDHVLVRERGELEDERPLRAPRALDEPAQGLSMRAEQDDSLVSEVVREEDDQVERRRVGPVQVFEHQQHRIGVIGEPRQRGLEHTQL